MNLSDIETMWEKDSQIDPDNLHTESQNIPSLHAKYYQLHNHFTQLKIHAKSNYDNIYLERHNYYSGKAEPEVYEKEPYSADRMRYPSNSFYSYVESVIVSSNAKTLAQPTLLVQEGEKAVVRSGESVITGVEKTISEGITQISNTREDAGLTVNIEVEKIDDNGFVTLKLNPTISVPVPADQQEGFQVFNINKRELNSVVFVSVIDKH